MTPGARDIKESINKQDFIKLKSFCAAKENISKMKREPTIWENMFTKDISDKGLISKIYKELTKLHTRKPNNPIKKWSKDLDRSFFIAFIERGRDGGGEREKHQLVAFLYLPQQGSNL